MFKSSGVRQRIAGLGDGGAQVTSFVRVRVHGERSSSVGKSSCSAIAGIGVFKVMVMKPRSCQGLLVCDWPP